MAASQVRSEGWVRAGYGLVLALWPGAVMRLVDRRSNGSTHRAIIRVLGVREAGQALVCAPRPTSHVLELSAAVDALHAATMFALASRSATWRRPALVSATIATSYSGMAFYGASQLPRDTGRPARRSGTAGVGLADRMLDLRDRSARRIVTR